MTADHRIPDVHRRSSSEGRREAALCRALGLPEDAEITPIDRPFKGLRFTDGEGKPLRFVTWRQLNAPALRRAWRHEMAAQ